MYEWLIRREGGIPVGGKFIMCQMSGENVKLITVKENLFDRCTLKYLIGHSNKTSHISDMESVLPCDLLQCIRAITKTGTQKLIFKQLGWVYEITVRL